MKNRSTVERVLPLFYFGLSLAVVALLLPTALRPPPSQPPTSAAFDANAPPEDEQVLVSELGRGQSSTAGGVLSDQPGGSVGGIDVPKAAPAPRKGRCFGNPARQTESLYSPTCTAAWVGKDNGGATYHGVTSTELHIGVIRDGSTAYEGPVDQAPADQIDDVLRTYRVFEDYFNRNFELYGRRVRFYIASSASGKSGSSKGAVIKLDDQYGMFAVVTLDAAASLETIRRKIILMGGYNNNNAFHAKYAPYSYSFTIDGSRLVKLTSEYICKQFWGKPVSFSGDPTFNGLPRKYGIAQYDDPAYYGYAEEFEADFKARCGGTVSERYFYQGGGDDDLQIMTKFKAANVTSVIFMGEYIGLAVGSAEATAQGYYPEWLGTGGGGTDINEAAQLSDKAQMKNFVNITSLEMMMPRTQKDYYRAYKEIDPENEPDAGPRFTELLQLVGGLQLTGPTLTPQTFQEAMFKRWPRRPPDPVWTIGGGYGPGDYTYPDYVALTWWDNAAIDPATDRPGAWRHVYEGNRFTNGEIPTAPVPYFKEGIERPPAEVQR